LGEEYAAYQSRYLAVGADVDSFKFTPWIQPSDVVIDFGCGRGFTLHRLRAARKIGVEPNPAARKLAPHGIEFVTSLSELEDGIADVVISNHALEHVLRPYEELCEMRRVLGASGRLVLWLPLERPHRIPPRDPDHHLFGWTPLTLRNLLAEAGFEVLKCRVVSHAWPPGMDRLNASLPSRVFTLTARATAVILRRRQLFALAQPVNP
jgi:SAM-dependent methyltransferase